MFNYCQEIKVPIRIIDTESKKEMESKPQKIRKSKIRFDLKNAVRLLLALILILAQGRVFVAFESHIVNVIAHICNYSEIRSCGYWKNHSAIYKNLLPQTLGGYPKDEIVDTVWKADKILNSACGNCGCGCDKSMRAKLKGQLLAMKFNIAHFGIGDYLVESEGKTLSEIVTEADDLLRKYPPPPDSVLEKMKDLLDRLNNLGHIRFCAVNLPPQGCVLQLTKTASSDKIGPGETITYHLTFDNIGNEVCTGGGVRLKDTFDKSKLQYIEYVSTRKPKWFNSGCGYLEWNFGSIYPNDPLIEIDLKMKVKGSAECDSTIINSAKYWSDQTDWGESVSAEIKVVCSSLPSIVINEFLPNPKGADNASMPNGEWVELYNKGNVDVDVTGWVLYDEKDSNELYITSNNTDTGSTIVPAGGFLVVYRNGDYDFALDNKGGDTVRLYDGEIKDGANLIDSHTYTIDAAENKSFARVPDGSDNWVDPLPTPGKPNVVGEEETNFGPAIAEEGEEGYGENENISVLEGISTSTKEFTATSEEISISTEESVTSEEVVTSTQQMIATATEEITSTSTEGIFPVTEVSSTTKEIVGSDKESVTSPEEESIDLVVENEGFGSESNKETDIGPEQMPAIEEEAVAEPINDSDENSNKTNIGGGSENDGRSQIQG